MWENRSTEYTQWMYDAASDSLYNRDGEVWTRWRRIMRRTRSNQFTECTGDTTHRNDRWMIAMVLVMPVPLIVVGQGSAHIHRIAQDTRPKQTPRLSSKTRAVAQGVRKLPKSIKWVLEKIRYPADNGRQIAKDLIRGKARCISDGSSKWSLGTSAATYITENEDAGI